MVITVDSDMIPFGCLRVMYKMDYSGHGDVYEKSNCEALSQFYDNDVYLVWLAVLAGCDYVSSPKGKYILHALVQSAKYSYALLYTSSYHTAYCYILLNTT